MAKFLLTPHFIKNNLVCPDGKKRIEFCDTAHPGLYVEARPNCDWGTFYLRYKDDNGITCHQKIGRTYELSLAEARKRAQSLKAEILLGADPRAEAKAQKAVMTLTQFANEHYLPYAEQRKRSYRNDESMLRLRLLPVFGSTPLNKLNRKSIVTFHSSLRDEGLAPATADHHIKLLRAMLNLAVQWDVIEKNPADKIKLFREDNTLELYLSEQEQARLLDVLATDNNRTVCLLVLFLLSTGARLNEALSATWGNIDTANKVWRIEASNSKSKRVRSVPLNPKALEVLLELKRWENEPHLFINQRTGKRYVNINKSWKRIKAKAGLPDLRLHDLRHQYASLLVNGGRSLYEVQQILGHSDPTVTQRYAHLSSAALQDAANAASDALEVHPPKTAKK